MASSGNGIESHKACWERSLLLCVIPHQWSCHSQNYRIRVSTYWKVKTLT